MISTTSPRCMPRSPSGRSRWGREQTRKETRNFIEHRINWHDTGEFAFLAAVERHSGWIGLSVPHFLPEVLPAVEVGWALGRR
jgi:RimJ/RimL family protein N-acetyltransferase